MKKQYAGQYEKSEKMEPSSDADKGNLMIEKVAVFISWFCVVVFFPFSICCCLYVVKEFKRIVVFRLGRLRGCSGPGLVFLLPCIDSFRTVDIRTDVIDSDLQDMLTKDSVTITVNVAVYHHVYNPIDWFIKVDDGNDAIKRISQVTLRSIIGSKKLHEILTSRERLSEEIQEALAGITTRWGARVTRVGLLERSLAAEAEASREARAKIILAEGEAKASQALKECSDVMSTNQITLQLRHLQILSSMAKERRVNVIFPIPLEIMEPFKDGKESSKPAQDDDDKRDKYKQSDKLNLYSPKVYIIGPPPDEFPDPNPNPNPEPTPEPDPESGTDNGFRSSDHRGYQEASPKEAANRENVDETRPGRSWQWPPFFRPSRRADNGEQPSGSRRTNQTDGIEPYPLLTKPPTRSSSPSTKPSSIPIPPRPDPPALPPVPSHPTLPPIPPHPTLPPLPERPTPPPKSTSPPKEKDPKITKPDKNYYF
ncbi:band 7 protein AGAP004871 isoform X2 [Drosophila subpulchrella]|uniref:band 7 protein AGAP004871 isoform X2 n=1 Tax=Drosophila subpulchrella TaxID=1486046 RepID=UPI0018A1AABB|nr:band 7 protein AGAP004871 isoform X2 [Drosophila subpulchrella]